MKDKNNQSVFYSAGAFLSMLLGGLLMIMLVVAFNKSVDKKENAAKSRTRIVKVKNTEKKVAKQVASKTKPKPKIKKTAPKIQPPDLSDMIGGIEMNIPELAAGSIIEGDANELLDDIAEDTIMSEDTVDRKPLVSYRAPIEYPSSAAKSGIKGYVVLNLLIAKDGSVKLAKILESQPDGIFETAVLDSIRDWRFAPARYNNEPVQVWVRQKVSFNS